MNIELSSRVQRVQPSPTLVIAATASRLRREGKDIIGLATGEPDFDTPDAIKVAAIEAIQSGQTKYTAVDGTVGLKTAVAAKFERDNGLKYAPDQILVSTGAKQSIFNLCQALLSEGDEAIIPAPYWVSYPDIVLLADAKPVIVSAGQSQGFKLTAEQLEAAMTPRTRLLMLNSPSNPSGVAYSEAELKALAEVLLKHPQVIIATDDIYEDILFDGQPFSNIVMACPELYDRTVVINGVSKAYAMTGWRIGYAGGPATLIKAMKKVQSQSTSNPCSISQAAAEAALNGPQDVIDTMVSAYAERHHFVHATLNRIEGVDCLPSDGTFYSFPNAEPLIERLPGIN
ncbi:MAG TPA: pyridoxal phosphate-dependent aminotransferase, partial [Gammaproteobacteria bacterium]|nr:pyridoxal phosphate-dependent aminotransferase [Gammaproteobacteria bacterium]